MSVGAAAAWAAEPQAATDEAVARKLQVSEQVVARLHEERALTNEMLLDLPPAALRSAMRRLEHPDIQRERQGFRLLQEQDENGLIPENAILRAARQLNEMKERVDPGQRKAGIPVGPPTQGRQATRAGVHARTAGIEASGWIWKGPGNIGGRTRSILVHPEEPERMWAGSVGGGIWASRDGGASWSPVDDFMANLAVCTMAMDPTDPKIMYAGTGEGFYNLDAIRGAGLFKSTDGGATWKQLASTVNDNFRHCNRLAISADGKVLLAATRNGIFRNAAGGAGTWIRQSFLDAADVEFHPTDPNLAIAGSRSGGAYYSTDGGIAWTQATGSGSTGRAEVTYAANNPKIVYASVESGSGRLYRSTDGGQSYTLRNSSTGYLGGQGWYDNVVWAGDPTNADLVIVGGIDLWKSTNGGTSFSKISTWWASPDSAHADHHVIVAHPGFNGSNNKTVFFGNDGGVYKTDNVYTVGNETSEPKENGWESLNNNYGVTQFYGAAGNVATGTIVGGAQDNGTLRYLTSGGPHNWTEMFGGDGGYCAADPDDSTHFYGEYVYLNIHRSTDSGVTSDYISGQFWNGFTWTWKSAPFLIPDAKNQDANFIAPFILDPNEPQRILGGGLSLWRTNDAKTPNTTTGGPKWEKIKEPVGSNRRQHAISAIAVAQGNRHHVWVGHNNGDIFQTTNGTAVSPTWTKIDQGSTPLPDRYCHRIVIHPTDHKTIYVTFGGYNSGNIWKSTNGGAAWQNISASLPEAPVRSLVVNPVRPDFVYVGTEVGVLASEDGGATWSPTNEGPTNCSVDELFWMGTKLVAATHGRGIFEIDLADEEEEDSESQRCKEKLEKLAKLVEELDKLQKALAKDASELEKLKKEIESLLNDS